MQCISTQCVIVVCLITLVKTQSVTLPYIWHKILTEKDINELEQCIKILASKLFSQILYLRLIQFVILLIKFFLTPIH